ncbi:MAG: hypothetical protein J6W64_05805 [Bacilli bacterium]|nr:hypothetical protein [Bacilli bacterium]
MPQYLYHVQFDNCIPGSIFGITFERSVDNKKILDTNCIMIGKTGHYEV